jgi:Zn-dependent M16 (insulinase) family peptidase
MKFPSNDEFIPGFTWNHFTTIQSQDIKELNARYVEIKHEPTGAVILHIQNEDPENLFCLSFRTLPTSSNGIAHVLEHTVLCGSKQFPIHDPFFSMNRRSLNTFMNALTGSDFTCYPAASLLEKDFYNLLEVYIDAVFFPKLAKLSFLQEAWRLEFEKGDDETTPLTRKGVVYNEMKGSLSSPMTRFHEKISSLLFKNVPYGFNSGGDPKEIPSLTIKELKEFHKACYHPSRCLFYFYGSFPLAKHLHFLETQILGKSSKLPPLPPLPLQPRFQAPVLEDMKYPATDAPINYCAVSWLTYPCTDIKKMLALQVLDSLLMETDASPLKRKILKSSLAQQAYSSLQIEQREASYSLTLTGTKKAKEAIQSDLFQFLEEIQQEGFQNKEIQRVLNQLELQRKEIERESSPFGLTLFWRSGLLKQQGIDPLSGLETDRYFLELHEELRHNPRYFSELLQEAFLKNPHMVLLGMKPSKTLQKEENAQEKKELQKIQESLTPTEKKSLVRHAKELQKLQNKEEDLSCLPSIQIKDIAKKNIEFTIEKVSHGKQDCYFSHAFTNHIVYIDLAFKVPSSLLQKPHLLRLYSLLLPQMGYGKNSWQESLELSQEYTGGIYSSISLNPSIQNPNVIDPYFHLHGNALSQNKEKLLEIMIGYTTEPRIDETERLEELLKKHVTSLETSLIPSSLRYVILETEKELSLPGHLQWLMSGRDYLEKIRGLSKQKETIQSDLAHLKSALFESSVPTLIATCTHEEQKEILKFFKKKPLIKKQTQDESLLTFPQEPHYTALQSTSPISFSSLAMPALPYESNKSPYLRLLAPLLDKLFLHKAIREQGGAYGGGASYNPSNSQFAFYTYRDPNIWKSYQTFQKALQLVADGTFKEEDLDEAKRECIQGIDEPISPSSIAQVVFHRIIEGKTEAVRHKFRTKLLTAKCKDLQDIARFLLKESFSKGSFTTMAGQPLLASESIFFSQAGLPLTTIAI